MSRPGVILLVHDTLDRAAQVARHWAQAGCPVVIHVDGRVPDAAHGRLRGRLEGQPGISFAPRHRCEWGTWSIVAATQGAARQMLDSHPGVSHVYLASGACLPLRPVAELAAYLDRHPDTDFIESVTTPDVRWTKGGLDDERFLYRFPFAWRRQRRLFDFWVALQRRLRLKRRLPEGIVPHLGSQWWCLTRQTLAAVLADPRRAEFDRFFRRVWIPDESYFQTLARRHARRIESRSLTLSKFDFEGRPHVFYDDHLPLLRRSGCFVARKIWPGAGRLYLAFLDAPPHGAPDAEPQPGRIERLFGQATHRRVRGRAGLRMQSRFPRPGHEDTMTAAPYGVLEGFADLYPGFPDWLARATGLTVHGHIFAPGRAGFAGGEALFAGALSDHAALRDHDPEGFLVNLIWNRRGDRQCFLYGPADLPRAGAIFARDRNARVSVITGAWAVPLYLGGGDFAAIRARAARLQAAEARHLDVLLAARSGAMVHVWPLAEFIEDPMARLRPLVETLAPAAAGRLREVPQMADLSGFAAFLQRLRNDGMNPYLVGDFPATAATGEGGGLPHPARATG